MKRFKYLLVTLVASSLVFQSCSEDKMDDINKDKNNPTEMESKYIITDLMTKSGFSVTGSDLAFYTSIYTELLGGGHGQMYNAQIREGEPVLASTYNNSWNVIYATIKNLNEIIKKCSAGGTEEGNFHTLGIAQILKAYNTAVLTDLFGDVPYSQAFNAYNSNAPLDKQEDLYKEIFSLLDQAIENLDKQSTYAPLGAQDLFYGGNTARWTDVAYGLKARYTMRLSKVKPDYQSVIDFAEKSFVTAANDWALKDNKIPYTFYRFAIDRSALFASQTYYDVMQSNNPNDPRLQSYFVKVGEEGQQTLRLLDAGSSSIVNSQVYYSPSGISSAGNVNNVNNAIYLLSIHEVEFLKAEAYARLNKPAEAIEALKKGIAYGLNKKQTLTYPEYQYPVDVNLKGAALIKAIAQAKYISFNEVEAIEMFNDIRRWKAMGEELIPLRSKMTDKFPQRLTYGVSDLSSNDFIKAIFGDGSYVYTEKVWWAGGTK